VTGKFVMPCPGPGITTFTITRADLDKPCVLSAPGIASREIPCPAEPAQFASPAALKAALAADKAALVGRRVQVTATRGTAAEVGCGKEPFADQIRVAVDGRVTAAGTLEDCAIWDY